jgi:alpha-1,3/alpha-1,6-mannosyltransferase
VSARHLRVAFVHPNLGLGGAERLVVDAALELTARGHTATIFVATHDRAHAFPETIDGRLDVRVHGAFLPARIAGRMEAMCTSARVLWVAAALARAGEPYDAVLADIVPFALPLLRGLCSASLLSRRTRLVYYCHYPDQLLAPPRRGPYAAYRAPIDRLEIPSMRAADLVLVNSRFTARALAQLGGTADDVLYPGVDVATHARVPDLRGDERTILALGRFDRRKNLPLLIDAFAALRERSPAAFARASLVVAGALDRRQPDDARVAFEIEQQARGHGIADKLALCASPREDERLALLARSLCVVHAATDEHFGLVPVEAMAAGRPVIAVAAGGPLETIRDGVTGFLRSPTPEAFADALATLLDDPERARAFGRAGRSHAARHFSRRAFGDALEAALCRVTDQQSAT